MAAQGFGEFKIAPGGGIEAEIRAVAFDDQRLDVRQGACLRRLRVAKQGAGSSN